MSGLEQQLQQVLAAVEQLRDAADDGPATRKLLDSLFRSVHNLKANASANGLQNVARIAHEFENTLHSLRTGNAVFTRNEIQAELWAGLKQEQKHALKQSLEEGANLFLVQTNFDLADFDRQFQSLKEKLNQSGEVISTAPMVDKENPGKLNFRILYAKRGELPPELSEIPNVKIETAVHSSSVESVAHEEFQDDLKTKAAALERSFLELSAELFNSRIASVSTLLDHALRAGQAAALATGKQVDFVVRGEDLVLDRSLCEAIADPLVHVVRNAVGHGIEAVDERIKLGKNPRGTVVIEFAALQSETRITVTDDGSGIDPVHMSLVFQPGFSTAPNVSEISGRGVGLDVVQTTLEELGGSVSVKSHIGQGAAFELILPNTR